MLFSGILEPLLSWQAIAQLSNKGKALKREIVQAIRELAAGRTDSEIATELNRRGLKSGKGRAFTADAVAWIRWKFKIEKPTSDPGFARRVGIHPDGSYSTSALAEKLGVGIDTIHYWRKKGILVAFQETQERTVVASGHARYPIDVASENPPRPC